MKLTLLFLSMDVLTLLAYPLLYAYSKVHLWTKTFKCHPAQIRND